MLSTCNSSSRSSSSCTQTARVVAVTIMPIMPRRQRRRQRQRQAAIAGTFTHASPKDNFLSLLLLLPYSLLLLSSSASSPLQVSLLRRNQRLSIYVAIFSLPSTPRRRRLEAAVCKVAGCRLQGCRLLMLQLPLYACMSRA